MTLTSGRHALKLLRHLVEYIRKEFTTKDSDAFYHLCEALKYFEKCYGEDSKGCLDRLI